MTLGPTRLNFWNAKQPRRELWCLWKLLKKNERKKKAASPLDKRQAGLIAPSGARDVSVTSKQRSVFYDLSCSVILFSLEENRSSPKFAKRSPLSPPARKGCAFADAPFVQEPEDGSAQILPQIQYRFTTYVSLIHVETFACCLKLKVRNTHRK